MPQIFPNLPVPNINRRDVVFVVVVPLLEHVADAPPGRRVCLVLVAYRRVRKKRLFRVFRFAPHRVRVGVAEQLKLQRKRSLRHRVGEGVTRVAFAVFLPVRFRAHTRIRALRIDALPRFRGTARFRLRARLHVAHLLELEVVIVIRRFFVRIILVVRIVLLIIVNPFVRVRIVVKPFLPRLGARLFLRVTRRPFRLR